MTCNPEKHYSEAPPAGSGANNLTTKTDTYKVSRTGQSWLKPDYWLSKCGGQFCVFLMTHYNQKAQHTVLNSVRTNKQVTTKVKRNEFKTLSMQLNTKS